MLVLAVRRLLSLGLALALLTSAVGAADDGLDLAWETHQTEAAERLAAVAKQAQAKKLFRMRDAIYERVLRVDPEHKKARSWLKYKRRGGTWVRSRYQPPKDRGSKSSRVRIEAALADWQTWWAAEITALHGRAAAAGRRTLARQILEFALILRGEDPRIRSLAGEARHGQGADARWVLLETKRALEVRTRFLDAAQTAAEAAAPPRPAVARPEDRADVVAWSHVLEGGGVRVLGTVGADELRRHHAIAGAAPAVFTAVFGVDPSPSDAPLPVYVTAGRAEGNAFLRSEPGIGPDGAAHLAAFDLAFLPERPGAVVKTEPAARRIEATCHAVQAHLAAPHLGQSPGARGAWARDAVSLYLAWLQVGTRSLLSGSAARSSRPAHVAEGEDRVGPFGRPRHDTLEDTVDLEEAATDWHVRAAEAIRDLTTPELRLLAAKPSHDLDALEILAAYGIAVYLIEAHPHRSAAFFRAVAAQEEADLDVVLTEHLGADLETLRPRLLRWLDEMGALCPPPSAPR